MSKVYAIPGWGFAPESIEPLRSALDADGETLCVHSFFRRSTVVDAFTRALPEEPVVLLGWSLGAMLALEFALTAPERVNAMILIAGGAAFVRDRQHRSAIPKRILAAMRERLFFEPEAVLGAFAQSIDSRALGTVARAESGELLSRGLEYLESFNVLERLSSCHTPCLLVHGRADGVQPFSRAQELELGLQNAKLLALEGEGHMPWLDCQEQVVAASTAFLTGL